MTDEDGAAPEVVVLDVGEVVIDETRVWATWARLLGVSGLTLQAVMGAAIVQGLDHTDALPAVAPNVDWTTLEDAHEAAYGGFRADDVYPDVRACIADLRADGVRVLLAGNQPARRDAQLAALDLGADDIATSAVLGADKPDPAFFAAVVARVGVAPDRVLYVGDRVDHDVGPAAAAGLRVCWLRRGPWGHLHDLPDDLDPDLVLEGLAELPLLLSGWRSGPG